MRRLLQAWATIGISNDHRVTLYTSSRNVPLLEDVLGEWIQIRVVDQHPFSLLAKLWWEQTELPRLLVQHGIDVLFCPGNFVPLRSSVPTVVLLQNAAPFCPNMTPSVVGSSMWLRFRVLGLLMRRSVKAAQRSIFVSHYLRNLFIERLGLPPERSDVIYHGTDGDLSENGLLAEPQVGGLFSQPYVLSVSHLYPYKNIRGLVLGFDLARTEMEARGLRLVLAGEPRGSRYYAGLTKLVRQRNLGHLVHFAGGVPHETVSSAMQGCDYFVFQSTCENCPVTLIEALQTGAPVCCSNAGVMPEIAGDAVLYFDPLSPPSIAEALVRMTTDAGLRQRLSTAARAQAAKFPTWQEVGTLTLAALVETVQGR